MTESRRMTLVLLGACFVAFLIRLAAAGTTFLPLADTVRYLANAQALIGHDVQRDRRHRQKDLGRHDRVRASRGRIAKHQVCFYRVLPEVDPDCIKAGIGKIDVV